MSVTSQHVDYYVRQSLQRNPLTNPALINLKLTLEGEARESLREFESHPRACKAKQRALENFEQCIDIVRCLDELLDRRRG